MQEITLFHNPRCSKSRAAKALLEDHGVPLRVVEYLKSPPGKAQLQTLARQLGGPVREMVRTNERMFSELGLDEGAADDEALLSAIAEHPILLQRPIAVGKDRAVIGRPPENVLELL